MTQTMELRDAELVINREDRIERYTFASPGEASARYAFISEAMSWIGTPFVDCGDIKGRDGCVDCAMLMVRSAVDTGLIPPFDPRPYSPRWHLHRSEELFIDIIQNRLGAIEVERPRVGDAVLWQFGRTFSHGGILINSEEVVHSYYVAGCCLISRLDEPTLSYVEHTSYRWDRPVKYFDLWSK